MLITGRLVEDAKVTTTKDNRQVVNFRIADNESYKAKGSTEVTKVVTYFNCSFWITPKVATWLKKGMTVLLVGRAGINAYINMEGQVVANLTFMVKDIKPLTFAAKNSTDVPEVQAPQEVHAGAETSDDLPF